MPVVGWQPERASTTVLCTLVCQTQRADTDTFEVRLWTDLRKSSRKLEADESMLCLQSDARALCMTNSARDRFTPVAETRIADALQASTYHQGAFM